MLVPPLVWVGVFTLKKGGGRCGSVESHAWKGDGGGSSKKKGRLPGVANGDSGGDGDGGEGELIFITFHHLLEGKSHTKEKEVVSAAKQFGMHGLIAYGTPAVVVLHRLLDGSDDEGEFLIAAKKAGKKGEVTFRVKCGPRFAPYTSDWAGVGKGGSGVSVNGWKGLRGVSMDGVKHVLESVGSGAQYRTVLGLA
jgi:hypothetical protein